MAEGKGAEQSEKSLQDKAVALDTFVPGLRGDDNG